jgi:hypothetical protein
LTKVEASVEQAYTNQYVHLSKGLVQTLAEAVLRYNLAVLLPCCLLSPSSFPVLREYNVYYRPEQNQNGTEYLLQAKIKNRK